jgi:argininosuccinate synthase
MSRIFRSLPPKGTRLAIAYSGGLDTRCAVAWLREQGMEVHAYTADLAQPDEVNPADIPPGALEHGAAKARLHIAYERLLSAIHNENTLDLYATLGRKLGRLLYEGKWFDPEACLLKDALTRWVAPSVTGEVTLELRRGDDYTIVATRAQHMSYGPDKLSMERVEAPAFTPEDRIGALELQNLSVGDNRDLLLHHLDSLRQLAPAGGEPLGRLLGIPDDPLAE